MIINGIEHKATCNLVLSDGDLLCDCKGVTQGYKNDEDKIERYDLIPVKAERYLAILFGCGAIKYEDRNWEKGIPLVKCIAAVKRHSNLILSGELIDPEDGIPHAAKLMWYGAILIEFQDTHPELLKPLRELPNKLPYVKPENKMPKPETPECQPKIEIPTNSNVKAYTRPKFPSSKSSINLLTLEQESNDILPDYPSQPTELEVLD